MTFEEALFTYLSTHAGLSALVSTRLYPVVLPQGATLPAVTYMRVSTVQMRTFGDPRMGRTARIQFTVWASTYASRLAVAQQLAAALEGYDGLMGGTGGVTVLAAQGENELDDYEPTAKVYQAALDFTFTYLGG